MNLEQTITLPPEFKCPECGKPLRLFHYKLKTDNRKMPRSELDLAKQLNGHPMISCGNWGKCHSPWRHNPNECPWHCWVAFEEDGTVMYQRGPDHILEENNKRQKFLEILMHKIRECYPKTYRSIRKFCQDWDLWRHT